MAYQLSRQDLTNYTYLKAYLDPVQTTNATQSTIDSILVAENQLVDINIQARGKTSTGTNFVMITFRATFGRATGGNITRTSSSTSSGLISEILSNFIGLNPSIDAVANTSTQSIDIKLTGKASTTINWSFLIDINSSNV